MCYINNNIIFVEMRRLLLYITARCRVFGDLANWALARRGGLSHQKCVFKFEGWVGLDGCQYYEFQNNCSFDLFSWPSKLDFEPTKAHFFAPSKAHLATYNPTRASTFC
jgi:hypothetical protein